MAQRDLITAFQEQIASGLKRHAVTSPSKWAETYRIMAIKDENSVRNEPWSFRYHPWLKEMHNNRSRRNVGQKAAQMGYTETLLNLAFHSIDILGRDVLYVLPNKNPECGDFSSGRFDGARELSPHLKNLFSETDNIGHKRAGHANFYIRGSHSRSGLKSNPIGTLLMDEVAEFEVKNIPLALERVSGQHEYLIWMVSTPTFEGHGISIYYNQSDKREFRFKCPSCSKFITLVYPDSLVITAEHEDDPNLVNTYYKCNQCDAKLPHHPDAKADMLQSGIWVPTVSNKDYFGYTINQLYSPTIHPTDIAKQHFAAQRTEADEVEFYNSKLGLSHETKGARVKEEDIQHAMMKGVKNKRKDGIYTNQIVTMGVDVGKNLHYVVCMWNIDMKRYHGDIHTAAYCILIDQGTVKEFEDLDKLMQTYSVLSCVVDKNPESRKGHEFATRYYGRVKLCIFTRGINGRMFAKLKPTDNTVPDEFTICVDRTSWIDQALGRYHNKSISLPIDTNSEYRDHIQKVVKTYFKDDDGNPKAKYVTEQNKPDHFAFAQTYCEMALSFVPFGGGNQIIG